MPSLVLIAALLFQQQAQQPPRAAGPTPTPEAVASDTGALRHANGRTPPVAFAVRATAGAPRIDGRLDDAVWALAGPITQFTQTQPAEGQPGSERTEARVAYDDDALYVAVRMYDTQPQLIAARLGRRDNEENSDQLTLSFDSYHDHRTAFTFGVNPRGVKSDAIVSGDGGNSDASWDPVWDAATQRDSVGWTAEVRIPLSQLRFPNASAQVWGFQVVRYIHRKAETQRWAWSSQTDQGHSSFFGHVVGLANLPRPSRLELLPYATAREERLASGSAANPFNDGSRERGVAGLDLQYGLASNLTLNATFNPDFGQVEADPAVVNLTAFENYFEERRPFFVEGADIFGFGGSQFFYSRRIGRAPQGGADDRGGFVDTPENSNILGAAKFSGRTAGGWSLGLLEAVTAREYATVRDAGGFRFRDQVEPLTNYGVFRAKRDFRGGGSTVGFIGTAVNRGIGDSRLDFLRSAAYAGGADFTHRFSQNRYRLSGSMGYSLIRGDTLAIQRAQLSSARYFERPDADYVSYDPSRTSLAGWSGSLAFAKEAGSWTYGLSGRAVSPGFELNDVGYLTSADDIGLSAEASRRWTRPGRVFRHANISLQTENLWNFGGVRTGTFLGVSVGGQFLNYWNANLNLALQPRSADDGLTRGGPLGISPASYNLSANVRTDPRKPWTIMLDGCLGRAESGGWNRGVLSEIELLLTPSVSFSASGHYYTERSSRQYLLWQTDPSATATFGRQYVFADIEQRNLDVTARLNVTLSPTLSLQLYAQPFVFIADYGRFKELAAPRTSNYTVYGETSGSTLMDSTATAGYFVADADGAGPRATVRIPDPDFSARSLRGNAVLRWEYRPGSTLFFVWTNSCEAYGADATFRIGDNLTHLCQGRSNNVFAVKLNYWLSL
jgi:hypothetical protein